MQEEESAKQNLSVICLNQLFTNNSQACITLEYFTHLLYFWLQWKREVVTDKDWQTYQAALETSQYLAVVWFQGFDWLHFQVVIGVNEYLTS